MSNFLCSKVLRFAFEQIVEILNNRFLLLFESFSFRYRSFLYKCFCIFCKVFSFRYRSFSSVLGNFSKFKVFSVQKQSFLCSKAKICSKVERFVLKCFQVQKFFKPTFLLGTEVFFLKSCFFHFELSFFQVQKPFSNVDLLLFQVSKVFLSYYSTETVSLSF